MTAQSREPETRVSEGQYKTEDTDENPDGQEPAGMRPEGREESSNPRGARIGEPTEKSPYKIETDGQSG